MRDFLERSREEGGGRGHPLTVSSVDVPFSCASCWEPDGVNPDLLDPTLLNFDNQRALQKAKYKGEFFPTSTSANRSRVTFVDFFQIEKFTGLKKGIILVELFDDPMMQVEASP